MTRSTLLCLAVAVVIAGCHSSNTSNANLNSSGPKTEISYLPPFATKEPDRYQATMVTTSDLGDEMKSGSGDSNRPSTRTASRILIARDGDRRRTEYEVGGTKIVCLQIPAGAYLLSPAKRVYADLNEDLKDNASAAAAERSSDFSPDRLINETQTGARYEKLGSEGVLGRTATKYRVTTSGGAGEAKNAVTETFIWVDDSLGIPIKSETAISGAGAGDSRYGIELEDIRLDVDPAIFELPKNYARVSSSEFYKRAEQRPD
jgi:hypothetical protein